MSNKNLDTSASTSLGSTSAPLLLTAHEHRLGITINHPRTPAFLKLSSARQIDMYRKIWHVIKNAFEWNMTYEELKFEFCKDGQVHLHVAVIYKSKGVVIGLISDLAKRIHACMPKKYSNFNPHCLYSNYNRYRAPCTCIQFYESQEEFDSKWITYINKYN